MSIDDLQAQLRGALDQQFAALKQQYEQAVAQAREQALTDAEQRAAARIAAARAELENQVTAIVTATRTEATQQAEQQARIDRQRLEEQLQQQLEQTVQHSVNSVRRSSELEIEALRRRVEQDVQAERQRAQDALEAQRLAGEQALQQERQARQQALDALQQESARALDAVRQEGAQALEAQRHAGAQALDEAVAQERQRAQAEIEEARGRVQAAAEEDRRRLEQSLSEERAHAAAELEAVKQLLEAEIASAQSEAAVAREQAAEAVAAAQASAAPAAESSPALARLPDAIRSVDAAQSLSDTLEALLAHAGAIAGRAALFLVNGDRLKAWKAVAIPEIDVQTVESSIGGRDLLARAIQAGAATPASAALPAPPFARLSNDAAVAVPLMINGRAVAVLYADCGGAEAASGWTDALDALVRHASVVSALRAAMRTLDVLRGDIPGAGTPANGNGEESARRYARLLVSEIKLYNEAAVRTGREHRDLRQRLRSEIDRAQRLYEERVPAAVGARDQYFHQELVQTLADGDSSLLGL